MAFFILYSLIYLFSACVCSFNNIYCTEDLHYLQIRREIVDNAKAVFCSVEQIPYIYLICRMFEKLEKIMVRRKILIRKCAPYI
jgi:hypothetical protein